MATMGLRINDGSRGGISTSTADIFAKALFGDPDREMKFARLESDLATDEYQRRQIAANTAYLASQEALKAQELEFNQAGVEPMAELGEAFVRSTQAPAPVEVQPTAPAVPPITSLVGPDRVLRPQPLSPDMPVAVEPVDALTGSDQVLRLQPPSAPDQLSYEEPVPVDQIPEVPPIDALTGPDQVLRLQPPAAQADPDFVPNFGLMGLAPVDVEPEVSDPHAALTIPGQPYMGPNMPAPVQPEIADPHAALTTPGEIADPHAALTVPGEPYQGPNMPVPIQPEIADPHAALTVPGEPYQGPDVPPPEEVTAAVADAVQQEVGPMPTFSRDDWRGLSKMAIMTNDPAGTLRTLMGMAGLTYGDPANGDKLRQAMALATGQSPTTTSVAGAADTAGVMAAAAGDIAKEKAGVGVKPKEGIISDKYGDREVYKDENGNTKIRWVEGGVKGEANIQVVNNIPYQVNTDEQGVAHFKLAEGFTEPEAPAFDVTSLDGAVLNKLVEANKKRLKGIPLTQEELLDYSTAYNERFGPKTSQVRLPDGRQDTITQFFDPPSDILPPDQMGGGAAAPAATAPAATAPAATAPETATGAAAAAAAPAAPATEQIMVTVTAGPNKGKQVPVKNLGGWGETPAPETTEVPTPGGKTVHTISGLPKDREVTGEAATMYETSREAVNAMNILNQYGPGLKKPPSGLDSLLAGWQRTGLTSDMLNSIVDQDTREYGRAVLTFINAPKRSESGAAVSAKEVADYIARYAMTPGSNNAREYFSARNARNQRMKATRDTLTSLVKPEMLQKLDTEMALNGLDIMEVLPTGEEKAPTDNKKIVRRPNDETGTLEEVTP